VAPGERQPMIVLNLVRDEAGENRPKLPPGRDLHVGFDNWIRKFKQTFKTIKETIPAVKPSVQKLSEFHARTPGRELGWSSPASSRTRILSSRSCRLARYFRLKL
jgi:hypothetical protein